MSPTVDADDTFSYNPNRNTWNGGPARTHKQFSELSSILVEQATLITEQNWSLAREKQRNKDENEHVSRYTTVQQ